MSTRNAFSQVSAESPTASALTLHTSASTPPSACALPLTQPASAAGSATSTAAPYALTPFAFSEATAAPTSSALRAQIETFAPSAAKPSAIARPMPLLPPVTSARLPLSPRSISFLLVAVGLDTPNRPRRSMAAWHDRDGAAVDEGGLRKRWWYFSTEEKWRATTRCYWPTFELCATPG